MPAPLPQLRRPILCVLILPDSSSTRMPIALSFTSSSSLSSQSLRDWVAASAAASSGNIAIASVRTRLSANVVVVVVVVVVVSLLLRARVLCPRLWSRRPRFRNVGFAHHPSKRKDAFE